MPRPTVLDSKILPRAGRAASRPRPFEVTVTCRGTADTGPHQLVCAGTHASD
jgi:guanyl-specific ribonuclease Sa